MSKQILKKIQTLYTEIYLDINVDFYNLHFKCQLSNNNLFIYLYKMKILNFYLNECIF